MSNDTDGGIVRPSGQVSSSAKGDAPNAVRRRYLTDERGGPGLGFYVDARIATAAFRDEGRRLVTGRTDPNALRDMAAIARHRGWSTVVVEGREDFRREAWRAARLAGLEVRGYRPTTREIQELERRELARSRGADPPGMRGPITDPAAKARLRVVEAVVRDRVTTAATRDRILAQARDRIATWLERGALFDPPRGPAPSVEPTRREHSRRR